MISVYRRAIATAIIDILGKNHIEVLCEYPLVWNDLCGWKMNRSGVSLSLDVLEVPVKDKGPTLSRKDQNMPTVVMWELHLILPSLLCEAFFFGVAHGVRSQ